MKYLYATVILFLFTVSAFAQAAAPTGPTFLDGFVKFAQSPGGIVATVLAVLEMALRLYPSQKALSVLVVVRYVTKSLVVIMTFIDSCVAKLIGGGQNLAAKKPAQLHKKR